MSLRSKAFAVLIGLGVASSAWGAERTDSAVGPAMRGAVQSNKTVGPAMRPAVQSHKTVGPRIYAAVQTQKTVAPDTQRTSDGSAQAPQKAEDKARLDLNAGF